MRRGFLFGVVMVASLCFMGSLAVCQEGQLSKEKITEIAIAELEQQGVALKDVNIVYDDGNTMWAERAVYLETDNYQNRGILPHGILKKKDYQVVYFDFMEQSPNKDIWVFVDNTTGDVLAAYAEK